MFDIGWTEMLVVGIVAILFVGPKELPGMLRTFGKSVKKIRALAGDFQQQFDDALKDAELDGVKDAVNDIKNLDPTKAVKDKLNPLKSTADDVKKSVEEAADFDSNTLFDESKAPSVDEPVEVDVDAALERQRKIDAEFAKVAPSSGKNAVPGFGGPSAPVESKEAVATPAKPKTAGKKATSQKTSSKSGTSGKAKPSAPKAKTSASKSATTKTAATKKVAQYKRKPTKKTKA